MLHATLHLVRYMHVLSCQLIARPHAQYHICFELLLTCFVFWIDLLIK